MLTRLHGDGTESPLDWDAPVFDDEITVALSGPDTIRGAVPVNALVDGGDGLARYLTYSTAVYAYDEGSGRVTAGGILTELVVTNGRADFIVDGFSTYPDGQPYVDSFSAIEADALSIYRSMWNHIQKQSGGDIGMQVVGLQESGLILGEDVVPGYKEVQIDGEWYRTTDSWAKRRREPNVWGRLENDISKTATSMRLQYYTTGNWTKRSYPFDVRIGGETVRATGHSSANRDIIYITRGVDDTKATKHYKNTTLKSSGSRTREVKEVDAKPWRANWWSTSDVGREMDRLLRDSAVEYREEILFSEGEFTRQVRMGKPIGHRQNNLRFVVGENIVETPEVVESGERWASEILVTGSGEGSEMKRGESVRSSGRLRRALVSTDKGARRDYQVQTLARRELIWHSGKPGVTDLLLRDTASAPFGSFGPGDQINVITDEGSGNLSMWVRILAITYHSRDDLASLVVERI